MAINKFIPGQLKIIDHRGSSTGYYEAVCDICGTVYYPKRSNSKYCNSKCAVVAHRKAMAEGGNVKKVVSKPKKEKEAPKQAGEVFRGNKAVYQYLKENYNTRGDREYILSMLKYTEVGGSFNYGASSIKRISAAKYEVV